MKVNDTNEKLEVVYTSIKGIKIYGFKDIMGSLSAHRGVAAEEADRFVSMNITKDELQRLIIAQKAAVNVEKDFVKAMAITQEIDYRLAMICEEKSLLALAYIYFLIEGEDDELPSMDYNLKKQALANDHSDIKAFFLGRSLELAGKLEKKQGDNLLSYLEETKKMADRIYRFISPNQ